MNQSIALAARFYPTNLAADEAAAQEYRLRDYKMQNMPLANSVERMGLEDDLSKGLALRDYRSAIGVGADPAQSLEKLNTYPETQDELYKHLDQGTVQHREEARKRAEAFANAAQHVMSFPKGTLARNQAYQDALQVLHEDGFIDDELFDAARKADPNDDVFMSHIMSLPDMIKKYTGPSADLTRARIDDIGTDNRRADEALKYRGSEVDNRNSNRNSRTNALNERTARPSSGMTGRGSAKDPTGAALKRVDDIAKNQGIDYGTPEYEDLKQKVFGEMGITSEGAAAIPSPNGGGRGDGTKANPFTPTRAEAEALPSGVYFLDPSGTLRKKK